MKFLELLAVIYALNVVIMFFTYYSGLDNYYPQTMSKIKNLVYSLSIWTNEGISQDTSFVQQIVDLLSKAAMTMLGIFRLIFELPLITGTFIQETFAILNIPFGPVVSALLSLIGIGINLYFVKVIWEWLRPGFTRNT